MIGNAGAVLTLGLGAFVGDPNHIPTLGYGTEGAAPPPPPSTGGGRSSEPGSGFITFLAWRPEQVISEKVRLQLELRAKKKKLKTVEKKIKAKEPEVFKPDPPRGILANLGALREQRAELKRDIEVAAVNLMAAKDFLKSLDFDDDEDDLEVLFL